MIIIPTNESYGYLRVVTRTARGALPVSKVLVTVKSYEGAESRTVASVLSDDSGMTPSARLPSPALENTQSPDASGPPFTLYNIDTDINGYYPVRNIGVQIYSGITSVQTIDLIPLAIGEPPPPAPVSEEFFVNDRKPNL